MKAIKFLIGLMALLLLASCQQKPKMSEAEITQVAKEAYIYSYPLVKGYKAMYQHAVDAGSPEFKKPFNEIWIDAQAPTPDNKTQGMQNVDLLNASVWFDLRREPYVLTIPPVEEGRYFSVQFVDLNTYNFEYLGTRLSGNKGGKYLVAGPNWKGQLPAGIDKVIQAETDLVYAAIRVQIHNAEDPANVKKIQDQFLIEPLSKFTNTAAPAEVPPLAFPAYQDEKAKTPEFFSYANFIMGLTPNFPEEAEMLKRFANLGVEAGKPFDYAALSETEKKAITAGMDAGQAELDAMLKDNTVKKADVYGTRAQLKNNYLYRAYGALMNLYAPTAEEEMVVPYAKDAEMKQLSGLNDYVIKLAKDQLPPANAFWSLTMYNDVEKSLVGNPINRYVISSEMLSQLVKDEDGGITLLIQKEAPEEEKLANWLPAPAGDFVMMMRLYSPKVDPASVAWIAPVIVKVRSGEPAPADPAAVAPVEGAPGTPGMPAAPGAQPAVPGTPAAVPGTQPMAPALPAEQAGVAKSGQVVPAPTAPVVAPAVKPVQPAAPPAGAIPAAPAKPAAQPAKAP